MKSVLIYSGGLDSTVLLHHLLAGGTEVLALSIDYGQRHRVQELHCARAQCEAAGVQHHVADLSSIAALLGGSSLTDGSIAVAHGHYTEDNMKTTVVPNRNMILLAIAGGWAVAQKADNIAYAAHGGDHAIYPDCRPEFADAMNHALGLCDWHQIELYRPFVTMSKADIVRRGAELGVDFAQTWSCYEGGELHCGRCGTCVERREAFYLAGVADPTPYRADAPDLQSMVASDWKLA